MNDLPPGWVAAQLDELISADGMFVDGDWVESKDQDPHGAVRLTQLADIGEGLFRDRSNRFLTLDKARKLRCSFLVPHQATFAQSTMAGAPLGASQPAVARRGSHADLAYQCDDELRRKPFSHEGLP